jgi:hypothetical protein
VKNAVLRLEFIVSKANEKVAFGVRSYLLILVRMRRFIGKSSRRIQVKKGSAHNRVGGIWQGRLMLRGLPPFKKGGWGDFVLQRIFQAMKNPS